MTAHHPLSPAIGAQPAEATEPAKKYAYDPPGYVPLSPEARARMARARAEFDEINRRCDNAGRGDGSAGRRP